MATLCLPTVLLSFLMLLPQTERLAVRSRIPAAVALGASDLATRDRLLFGPSFLPFDSGVNETVLADFDGDGQLDQAITSSSDHTVSVRLGDGTGSFGPPIAHAVGINPLGPATGDLNGDGHADLVVANNGSDDLSVLMGTGAGRFAPAVSYPVETQPLSFVLADIDTDGDLDIVCMPYLGAELVRWFNRGDGTFSSALGPTLGLGAHRMAAGDFNGDGNIDLAIGGTAFEKTIVLSGNGNGEFGRLQVLPLLASDLRFAVLGPGPEADLFAATGTALLRLRALPNGTLTVVSELPTSFSAQYTRVIADDFNADGALDVGLLSRSANKFCTLLGDGNGTLSRPACSLAGGIEITSGDLNGDGVPDLVSALLSGHSVALGKGDGHLRTGVSVPGTGGGPYLPLADVDRDGLLDVVSRDIDDAAFQVLYGTPSGGFELGIDAPVAPFAPTSFPSLTADFDLDSQLDMVLITGGAIRVHRNLGERTFGPATHYLVGGSPWACAAGDVDSDGLPDLLVALKHEDSLGLLRGRGDGSFSAATTFFGGDGPVDLTLADFNADTILDLAVVNEQSNRVTVWRGTGSGAFFAGQPYPVAEWPQSIRAQDLDGDGRLELIVTSKIESAVTILHGEAAGLFSIAESYPAAAPRADSSELADFDQDGTLDLITLAGQSSSDTAVFSLRLGLGDGTFGPMISIAAGNTAGLFAVGDVTHDGRPDLLLPSQDGVTILRNRP